jgi:hypothetical protein
LVKDKRKRKLEALNKMLKLSRKSSSLLTDQEIYYSKLKYELSVLKRNLRTDYGNIADSSDIIDSLYFNFKARRKSRRQKD